MLDADVNRSESLCWRAPGIYSAMEAATGQEWREMLAQMRGILSSLERRYPQPVAQMMPAWNAFSRELATTGRLHWRTADAMRQAANRLTGALEQQSDQRHHQASHLLLAGLFSSLLSASLGVWGQRLRKPTRLTTLEGTSIRSESSPNTRLAQEWMKNKKAEERVWQSARHRLRDNEITERLSAEEALRESEARFRAISNASPLGIFVTTPDGRCQYVNAQWKRIAGLTDAEAEGEGWANSIHPEDRAQACQRWRIATKNNTPYDDTYRFQRNDGRVGWAHVKASAMLTETGELLGYVGSVEDVTERMKVEAALKESEHRLAEAQRMARLGSYEFDFATCTVIWSEEIYRLFDRDLTSGPPGSEEILSYYHPDDREALLALRKQAFLDGQPYEADIRIRQRDGSYRWCRSVTKPVRDENGNPLRIVGTLVDIHERKIAEELIAASNQWLEQANLQLVEQQAALVEANAQLEQQILLVNEQSEELEAQKLQLHQANKQLEEVNARLESLASTDGLTGLKNHRTFQERLAECFSHSRRYNQELSLLLVDVDHFKQFNDTYGHPVGDEVLKRVAATLLSAARTSDFVARYGGEEFVLLLPETDAEGAVHMAERVKRMIEEEQWEQRQVTVSIGIASLQPVMAAPSVLVDEADRALYTSKANGRNQFTLYAVA